jgi:hypothetical protein
MYVKCIGYDDEPYLGMKNCWKSDLGGLATFIKDWM